MKLGPEQLAEIARATKRGRAIIRPGDVIVRAVCMGGLEPFIFRAWEGSWMCGNYAPGDKRWRRDAGWDVCDCTAIAVRSVNGHAVDLSDVGGPLPDRQALTRPATAQAASPAPAPPDLSLTAPFHTIDREEPPSLRRRGRAS